MGGTEDGVLLVQRQGACCSCIFAVKGMILCSGHIFAWGSSLPSTFTWHFTAAAKDFVISERWQCVTSNSFIINKPVSRAQIPKMLFVTNFVSSRSSGSATCREILLLSLVHVVVQFPTPPWLWLSQQSRCCSGVWILGWADNREKAGKIWQTDSKKQSKAGFTCQNTVL